MTVAADARPLADRIRDAGRSRQRLDRCAELEERWGGELNDSRRRLLRHCAFSAYLDLRELGVVPPEWLDSEPTPA